MVAFSVVGSQRNQLFCSRVDVGDMGARVVGGDGNVGYAAGLTQAF